MRHASIRAVNRSTTVDVGNRDQRHSAKSAGLQHPFQRSVVMKVSPGRLKDASPRRAAKVTRQFDPSNAPAFLTPAGRLPRWSDVVCHAAAAGSDQRRHFGRPSSRPPAPSLNLGCRQTMHGVDGRPPSKTLGLSLIYERALPPISGLRARRDQPAAQSRRSCYFKDAPEQPSHFPLQTSQSGKWAPLARKPPGAGMGPEVGALRGAAAAARDDRRLGQRGAGDGAARGDIGEHSGGWGAGAAGRRS